MHLLGKEWLWCGGKTWRPDNQRCVGDSEESLVIALEDNGAHKKANPERLVPGWRIWL